MYYYFHGMVTLHTKNSVVVECSGIGYDILVCHPDEFPIGETLFVYTVPVFNENEQYLVGFRSLREKDLYLALTSVKGIGPKTALNALASTTVDRLSKAIEDSDDPFLMRLPGIGKKNASQIILDLKGKLQMLQGEKSFTMNANMDTAYEGLKLYGFKDYEIKDALAEINDTSLSAEEYLKRALEIIANKKHG